MERITRLPLWARIRPFLSQSSGGGLQRNIVKLAGATSLGCLAAILGAPLLTRLYDPTSFGQLALFMSLVGVLTAPASGRYEFALPLARNDRAAQDLLWVCFGLLIATVGGVYILAATVELWRPAAWATWGSPPRAELLAVGMLCLGAFQILRYWAIRHQRFSHVALGDMTRSILELTIQLALGWWAFQATGLIVGFLMGYFAAAAALSACSLQSLRGLTPPKWRELRTVSNEFIAFPLYSAPSSLINTIGMRAPLVLIALLYGAEAAGWFALADRIFALPTRLLGSAVSDVFFAQAAHLVREAPQRLPPLLYKVTGRLLLLAIPIGLAAWAAPPLFGWVFGAAWESSGIYCRLLAAPFALRFVALATSLLTTYGANKWQLVWEILRLLGVSSAILAAHKFGYSHTTAVLWYGAVSALAFGLLYLLNVLAIARLNRQ